MNINAVEVIVKGSVKPSKHEQESANEGCRVSSSSSGTSSAVDKSPLVATGIEVVQLILVFRVSSSKDEHLLIVGRGRVAPSRLRNVSCCRQNCVGNLGLQVVFNELGEVELAYVCKRRILIFINTASIHKQFTPHSTSCMKSSGCKLCTLELQFLPLVCFEIKSPHVV